MARVKDELRRLEVLEMEAFKKAGDFPSDFMMHELWWLSTSYLKAAKVVCAQEGIGWQPFVQLTGHATECALKVFLMTCGAQPPRGAEGHNLIELLHSAEEQGLRLNDIECRAVIALSRLYAVEPFAGQRYLSRYPAGHWLESDLPVPSLDAIEQVVKTISRQSAPPEETENQ